MKTVLVTGAAGFLGSHLCKELLQQGHRVVGIDDFSGGFRHNLPKGLLFEEMSILDEVALNTLFQKYRFQYVYHFAAYAAEGLSHFIRHYNYQNNVLGSIRLINAAVRYELECFVYASSIAVYGHAPNPLHEERPPQPADPYGIAKWAVEQDLRAAKELFDLNYLIFRPHNVYGPHQNIADPYRNVVGIFMNQLLQEQPLSIFGDGQQTRAFTYMADIIPIMAVAPFQKDLHNQVFNIGADKQYKVIQLAEAVMQAMDKRQEIVHLPARQEVVHAQPLHDKFERYFGPLPQTPLEEGLAKMAKWVLKIGPQQGQRFEKLELTKGLPPNWQP